MTLVAACDMFGRMDTEHPVKVLRERVLGLSREDFVEALADETGCRTKPGYLRQIEDGHRDPGDEIAGALVDFMKSRGFVLDFRTIKNWSSARKSAA